MESLFRPFLGVRFPRYRFTKVQHRFATLIESTFGEKRVLLPQKIDIEVPRREDATSDIKKLYDDLESILESKSKLFQHVFCVDISLSYIKSINARCLNDKELEKDFSCYTIGELADVIDDNGYIVISPLKKDFKVVRKILGGLCSSHIPIYAIVTKDGNIKFPYPIITEKYCEELYKESKHFTDRIINDMSAHCQVLISNMVKSTISTKDQIIQKGIILGVLNLYKKKVQLMLEQKRQQLGHNKS